MGYEIKLIIGRSGHTGDEWKMSTRRYADDSGFEPEKDANGNIVTTGRKEIYFQVMAELDLCKLGYEDNELNRLIKKSHDAAKAVSKTTVWYFYGPDGTESTKEDRYGDPMAPVPLKEVLAAMKQHEDASSYRRLKWAIALLEEMAKDGDADELQVLFFGH